MATARIVRICAAVLLSVAATLWAEVTPADHLSIASVQMRSTRDLDDNVRRTIEFIETAAKKGARVVVFPECSITGYYADSATAATKEQLVDAEKRVAAACVANKVYAVIGMPWREKGKLYNSAVIISPEGKTIERFHKMQLVAGWPDPGDHLSIFKIDGVWCTTIVCHDERYPELVRLPVLCGAQVVFYISHESGIKSESKIDVYRAQIQARAVENGVWVIHSNAPANSDASGSNGHSRIIAPDGNIVEEASVFKEDIVLSTIDIGRAGRGNAQRSLRSDPLRDWWQQGMKLVRVIEDE